MLADLVPEGVHVQDVFGDPESESMIPLFPAEEAVVDGVHDGRRKEFTTVRACARRALAHIGVEPAPLVPGRLGAPRWPAGIVGSMTHCRGYRAAAIARAADFAALGIDAEPQEPLPRPVAARFVTEPEGAWLRRHFPQGAGPPLDRLLMCAKEASYKAFSHWMPPRFGFLDFTVRLRPDGTFHAVAPSVGTPSAVPCAAGFAGRWAARSGFLLAVVALSREEAGGRGSVHREPA